MKSPCAGSLDKAASRFAVPTPPVRLTQTPRSEMVVLIDYVPNPQSRPFVIGDAVEVVDSAGTVVGRETVTGATLRKVTTACGRTWLPSGEWLGGKKWRPFPTIRHKAA